MTGYIARRLILALFTIWVISILTFVIIELPAGDTADAVMNNLMDTGSTGYSPEVAENLRRYLGLDQPQYVRYFKWTGNLLRGDPGFSMTPRSGPDGIRPIKAQIGDRLWITVALTRVHRPGYVDVRHTRGHILGRPPALCRRTTYSPLAGFTGLAIPDFLLGLVLMYIGFAYFNQSVGGLFSADYQNAPWDLWKAVGPAEAPLGYPPSCSAPPARRGSSGSCATTCSTSSASRTW